MSKIRTLKPETNGDPVPDLKVMLQKDKAARVQRCAVKFNDCMEYFKQENCVLHYSQIHSRLKGIEEHVQILAND